MFTRRGREELLAGMLGILTVLAIMPYGLRNSEVQGETMEAKAPTTPGVLVADKASSIVHVAAITHKHGVNFYVAKTEKALQAEIHEFVKEWWEDMVEEEDPTGNAQHDVQTYFEHSLERGEFIEVGTAVVAE